MYQIMMLLGAVTLILSLLLFLCSAIYYAMIRPKYYTLLADYAKQGLRVPARISLFKELGFIGVPTIVTFYKKLLTGKKILIGHKEYLDAKPYQFLTSQGETTRAWIRRLILITISAERLFYVSLIFWVIAEFILK